MPFNILLPGTKSLWVPQPARVLLCLHLCLFPPGLRGGAWPLPSVSCVGLSSLYQQHLECVREIQRGQMKFTEVPRCQKPSNQFFPICLAFYLQSKIFCSMVFTSKIRVWMASQQWLWTRPACGVLVNAWDLSEMLLDALVKPYTNDWGAHGAVCLLKGKFIRIHIAICK